MTAELYRMAGADAALDAGYSPPESRNHGAKLSLDAALDSAFAAQHHEGYWCYEFEADCTIPAEYVLMMHFMGEIDWVLEQKIAVYLRSHQAEQGDLDGDHAQDLAWGCPE